MNDLRALAERLGLLKDCECSNGCGRCDCGNRTIGDICRRLPTEAEVRAAIFDAGWTWMDIFLRPDGDWAVVVVQGARRSDGPDSEARVADTEAADEELVLLALLRALEMARVSG